MHGMRAFNLDSGNRFFVCFSLSQPRMGKALILQLFQGQFALTPQAVPVPRCEALMFFA
jgi:hypothetical protein